jgi:hypothetical protein
MLPVATNVGVGEAVAGGLAVKTAIAVWSALGTSESCALGAYGC